MSTEKKDAIILTLLAGSLFLLYLCIILGQGWSEAANLAASTQKQLDAATEQLATANAAAKTEAAKLPERESLAVALTLGILQWANPGSATLPLMRVQKAMAGECLQPNESTVGLFLVNKLLVYGDGGANPVVGCSDWAVLWTRPNK